MRTSESTQFKMIKNNKKKFKYINAEENHSSSPGPLCDWNVYKIGFANLSFYGGNLHSRLNPKRFNWATVKINNKLTKTDVY